MIDIPPDEAATDARLAILVPGGGEMQTIHCPKCGYPIEISLQRHGGYPGIRLDGTLTCLRDNFRWPIRIQDDTIRFLGMGNVEPRTAALDESSTPIGLRDDLQEAERALEAECYKASAMMSRRVIQLALEDKGAKGRTLGPVLDHADVPPENRSTDT